MKTRNPNDTGSIFMTSGTTSIPGLAPICRKVRAASTLDFIGVLSIKFQQTNQTRIHSYELHT